MYPITADMQVDAEPDQDEKKTLLSVEASWDSC